MSQTANTRFSFDEQSQDNAKIKVVGVGGGGGNAINNMIDKGLNNVEYVCLNTDAQALQQNRADVTIQVGKNLTNGLGAGARPEIGREAVEENRHEIEESIEGADMVFITAGMGGGTGTGGGPVVANIAKRKGILTVGIVTMPFLCEGKVRMNYAVEGINELKKCCDTVIVIPNERLLDICDENTTLMEAFEHANEVLYNATRGISDLILMPGLINLDFADVRTTMLDGGAAIMGSATATGADRAEIAAREALSSPLLDGISIRGASNVLVNISAGANLGMKEATKANSIIQQEAGEEAEIIWGTVLDEDYGEDMRITVIATGFDYSSDEQLPMRGESSTQASGAAHTTHEASAPEQHEAREEEEEAGRQESGQSRKLDELREKFSPPKPEEIPRRYPRNNREYYKGEKNLKHLDSPAIHRRKDNVYSLQKKQEEEESQQKASSGKASQQSNVLLNNREERIDKSDSEQPAFLRKIMD